MNEQTYLELVNQLKEKFDENDIIKRRYIRKYNNLYKIMAVCYGLTRTYIENNPLNNIDDIILGELRGYMSSILFDHLEDTESDDE
tara:strand:- start:2879 stop:3136 length:258 start_codon:yes stop_codon:yes gene_type:complete